jgi:hypothetical protein
VNRNGKEARRPVFGARHGGTGSLPAQDRSDFLWLHNGLEYDAAGCHSHLRT